MRSAVLALLALCAGCAAGKSMGWPLRATIQPASQPVEHAGSVVTIATYNLHGVRDPDGLRDDLRRIDADVWLFQEVRASADLRTILPDGQKWNIAMLAVNRMSDGKMEAQAIATRFPVVGADAWPLEARSSRRRCALAARVRVGSSGEILVVDTDHEPGYFALHVAHEPQLRSLVERLSQTGGPVIVGGDFNTCGNFWRLRSSRADAEIAMRDLAARGFAPATTQPSVTFFAGPVRGYLDQIYARNMRVIDAHVASDARGSDHRPVVSRISWSER